MPSKALTQTQIIDKLATSQALTKVQVKGLIQAQADLAYKEAKNGYTIAGLGKLVIVARKARMGRNPRTGATIKIGAKKVLKFKVSKICKDAIAPPSAAAKKKVVKKVVKKK